jgi:hypothetical protein
MLYQFIQKQLLVYVAPEIQWGKNSILKLKHINSRSKSVQICVFRKTNRTLHLLRYFFANNKSFWAEDLAMLSYWNLFM